MNRTTRQSTKRRGAGKEPRRTTTTPSPQSGDQEKIALLTRELREALEQQAATGEVLKVISHSEFDLHPVLQNLLQNAVRLCDADMGGLYRQDGAVYRVAASCGHSPEFLEMVKRHPIPADRSSAVGRAVLERRVVHIHDVFADPEYGWGQDLRAQPEMHRTILAVPMLREGGIIGVIIIRRAKVQPFTEKQIALLTTFADHAAVAIENARLLNDLRDRTAELTEALDQQTATADVLKVISRSTFDIQAVLNTLADSAGRLCQAENVQIFLRDGEVYRLTASNGFSPEYQEYMKQHPITVGRGSLVGRTALEVAPVHIADVLADQEYTWGEAQKLAGFRTMLGLPLLRDGICIGVMSMTRGRPQPFAAKQIELVITFADQAVIAIENARLFEEVRARNRDLTEALTQQTATSELLKVIGRSTFDLQPVFDTLAESAIKLCAADRAFIFRFDGQKLQVVTGYNISPELRAFHEVNPILPGRDSCVGRMALERRTIHIHDVRADPEYTFGGQHIDPYRTLIAVPMLRAGELLGAINIVRYEILPFTDSQIALLETFADQAVIAIENVRLFNEVQARSRELSESLEQQTATSEILGVISSSLTDTQPVFDIIVQSGIKLFPDAAIAVALPGNNQVRVAAIAERDPKRVQAWKDIFPFPLSREYMHGVAILDRQLIDIPDVQAHTEGPLAPGAKNFLASGYRAITIMPMMRGDAAIGAISVIRLSPGPLSTKQVNLLHTFADQAVIAIENVRLFDEVQARTRELSQSVEELRALGEVSQTVNSSLDLETVLTTIVAKAVQLSGTDGGAIYVFDENTRQFQLRATHGTDDAMIAAIRQQGIRADERIIARATAARASVQIADLVNEPTSPIMNIVIRAGYRALLVVPLLRPGEIIGTLVVRRKPPGEFPQSTIDLLETFADQSVLAIQNARLFQEIEAKSREIAEASKHKSQFLANMSHELRTPLNAILGYAEMMVDGIYGEPSGKMRAVLERLQANGRHLLGLINDVLDLSKIEAGQLTLSLDDYSLSDVVHGVVSAVEPLAAEKRLAFKTEVAPDLPRGRGDERRLSQVLLNLVGNAIKFTDKGEVAIRASATDGAFTVAVCDTGPGISATYQAKIFEEFQQADSSITRKKGGTGLGLSIAKRIIEMHGGRLWVESQPGKGSTFYFALPVRVEAQPGKS